MKTKQFIQNTMLLFLISITTWAQESPVSAGGETSGAGGIVSYSIGQVFYTGTITTEGSVSEGVQQAYEIFVLSTQQQIFTMNLTAYPNPTQDNLNLHVDEYNNEKLRYKLYTMSGTLLETKFINETNTSIDFSKQVSGIYLLKVFYGNQEIQTFKIVKR